MKKFSLFFTCIMLTLVIQAQTINSLTVVPASPTPSDTIYVYADCIFPYTGCSDKTQFLTVNGNTFSTYAMHCMGMLTALCNETDTFKINPLPAGSYTFIFQVDAGQGQTPCTPGIVPGPVDSVVFHVSVTSGTVQPVGGIAGLQMLQGVKPGSFICRMSPATQWPVTLHVNNSLGQRILSTVISANNQEVDLSRLDAGIYIITPGELQPAGVKIRIE
jgi:hypothetical protein